MTPHQTLYAAHMLTRAGADGDAMTQSLSSARVDLNPHQVDAALFALRSPLSRGVILADEVGLGKTIEAALVIAQRWWERRRKILLIVPASLRKQWAQELFEKFALPSTILDGATLKERKKAGEDRPFASETAIIITSYEFGGRQSEELAKIPWDLVVFDEAHKLRNVYKADSKARAVKLRDALKAAPKLLLTATPLQNNLMELYGLVSILDEHFFGSPEAFRAEFGSRTDTAGLGVLGARLKPISVRTLRRQVQRDGLIKYTDRRLKTYDFTPRKIEQELYEAMNRYLQRDDTLAIGQNGRHLVTLMLRRILGSSSFAVAQTLSKIIARLERRQAIDADTLDDLDDQATTNDEWAEADGEADVDALEDTDDDDLAGQDDAKLSAEIAELKGILAMALSLEGNAKADALVGALPQVLDEIVARNGQRKVVIFTESVRTQAFLRDTLEANGFAGQVAILNGSNADTQSKAIYRDWIANNAGTGRISGSKTADMKAALVDAFRNDKTILIATESGAEGINLQFCSLLVNYDLPWNPQRVEQRIGRCHRYGQKIDVTVINFINLENRAEARVFELLEQKFNLFSGVFGASDEVLGAIESGVDVERRILEIVQQCRHAPDIDAAFDALQLELQFDIDQAKKDARDRLLAEVDDKVIDRLKSARDGARKRLNGFKVHLAMLAKGALPEARFHKDHPGRFDYGGKTWTTEWPEADERGWQFFRLIEGSLAADLVAKTKGLAQLPVSELTFALDDYDGNLSDVANLKGKSGWLQASSLHLASTAQTEDHVILTGRCEDGQIVHGETLARLMLVPAIVRASVLPENDIMAELEAMTASEVDRLGGEAQTRLGRYLDEESQKLDLWREDARISFEGEIRRLKKEANQKTSDSRTPGMALDAKVALQRESASLSREADAMNRAYYERMSELDNEVNRILDEVAAKLGLKPSREPLFVARWRVA